MSLFDTGSIEELKRRMQAGPPAPQNASMGAPPPIPAPFLPPNIPAIPRMPEPSPEVYQRAMVSQGPGGLLARPEAPAEYRGLFNRDELMQATPGRVQSLLGRMIGERPQDIMRMNLDEMGARKAQGGEWQDKIAARKDASALKAQMAALRQKYASGGGDFRNFAAELAMLRPELAGQLSGMVNAMEPPNIQSRNIDPNSPEGVAARLAFEQGKPRPSNELTPYQRESLRLRELELRMRGMAQPAGAKAPRPPTEAQEKSHIFYNLMANSAPEIDALVAGGNIRPDMITLALRSGVLDFATNRMLNDDEQKLIRAARDFTAGVLRKESGAAIKNDEILNTFQRMITLSGERGPVADAKQKARQSYMKTMERSAMPATMYYRALEGGVPTFDPDYPDAQGDIVPVRSVAPKSSKPHARY